MTTIKVSRGTYTGYDVILKTGGVYSVDANIDMNANDITDLDDISFTLTGQDLNSDTSGLHFTLPSGDVLDLTINSVLEYGFSATEFNLHENGINEVGLMTFASTSTGGSSTVTISSFTGSLHYNVLTGDNHFFRVNGNPIVDIDEDRLDINNHFLQMTEMTAPTGSSNIAKVYAQDNGAGKTQLMVIFATGSAQQIAIQP